MRYVPSIVKMCGWMEVSRSGFYEWRNAPRIGDGEKARDTEAERCKALIRGESDEDVRVPAGPRGPGGRGACRPGRSWSGRLMRELGLEPCQPRPWRRQPHRGRRPGARTIPDLVNRDFTADAPGEKMVGDITYISDMGGLALPGDGHRLRDAEDRDRLGDG